MIILVLRNESNFNYLIIRDLLSLIFNLIMWNGRLILFHRHASWTLFESNRYCVLSLFIKRYN